MCKSLLPNVPGPTRTVLLRWSERLNGGSHRLHQQQPFPVVHPEPGSVSGTGWWFRCRAESKIVNFDVKENFAAKRSLKN